jgi:hypothetical protein
VSQRPNRRLMARDRGDLDPLSLELVGDRSSNGRQPAELTGRLSLSHFHNGVPKGSPSLLCPSPEPEPNPSQIAGTVPAIGQTVILNRPARGNGLVSRTVGFGSPPLPSAVADPLGVFVAGNQRFARRRRN